MKLKTLLFITPLLTLSTSLFAKNILIDSIGIENNNGKKVILHKLDPKDNYYSLGRRYNVSPKDIMTFNNNAPLIIGNVVKIPTNRPFLETANNTTQARKPAVQQGPVQQAPVVQQPQPQAPQQQSTIDYKVSAGETLYSIAKRFRT